MKKEPLVVIGCCSGVLLAIVIVIGALITFLLLDMQKRTEVSRIAADDERQAVELERLRVLEERQLAEESILEPGPSPSRAPSTSSGAQRVKSQTQAEKAALKAEPIYESALKFLRESKFEEAGKEFNSASRSMRYHGNNGIIDNAPAQNWIDTKEGPFVQEIEKHVSVFQKQFEDNQPDLIAISQFLKAFNYLEPVRDQMSNLRDQANSYIKLNSKHYLLVSISPSDMEYLEAVKSVLRSKYPKERTKYDLYFRDELYGLYVSAAKRMQVNLRVEQAQYRDQRNAAFYIPESALVTISMSGDKTIKTSWDAITPYVIKSNIPERLAIKNYDQKIVDEFRKKLADEFKAKADAIPPFTLFPGIAPDSINLINANGEIDVSAAETLAAIKPQRLKALVSAETSKEHSQQETLKLCEIIVTYDLTEHADYVLKVASTPGIKRYGTLSKAIGSRPDFANYAVIRAMMRRSNDWQLERGLKEAAMVNTDARKVIEELCLDSTNPNRAKHAQSYLTSMPESQRPPYQKWLLDKDPDFAKAVWFPLASQPHLVKTLILKNYGQVGPAVRSNMWQSVYSQSIHGSREFSPELLQLNAEAAVNTDDATVASSACRAMLGSNLKRAEVLKAAMGIRNKIPEKERRTFASQLAAGVPTTDPEQALDVYLALLDDEQKHASALLESDPKAYDRQTTKSGRVRIIEYMLNLKRKDGLADGDYSRLKSLREKAPEGDYALDYAILKGIERFGYRGKIDYSSAPLKALIQKGLDSKHRSTRVTAYTIASQGMKKSEDGFYKSSLEKALGTEKDSYALGYLKRYLKK